MDSKERQQYLLRISEGLSAEQTDAAWALTKSADASAIEQLFAAAEQAGPGSRYILRGVIDGLIDGAPSTLPIALAMFEKDPFSRKGKLCAYVLGEIAYRQGKDRDPRIVQALVDTLAQYVTCGSETVSAIVASLRECARGGAIQTASDPLRAVLEHAKLETQPYMFCLDNALAVLYVNDGSAFISEARNWLAVLSPGSELATAVREFLSAWKNSEKKE